MCDFLLVTILAIETSCDETAVAILRDRNRESGPDILASEVASQIAAHEKFGGVVPELASRNHLAQLPHLLDRATTSAKIAMNEIDAFAATSGPGLASSLLVGNSTAKGLAIGAGKPFLAINHLEGHLLSPFFGREKIAPNISLIVSGGHTLLVKMRVFDKVARLLGLSYPGGPAIEARAKNGNPKKFDLPRSMLNSGDLNFSFSGLKTAVRYLLQKPSVVPKRANAERPRKRKEDAREIPRFTRDDRVVNDLCASFQRAVIDVLREKSIRALRQTNSRTLTLSGGVSCNYTLREDLLAICEKNGIEFLVAEPWLCTDNAAMIAFAALLRLQSGLQSEVTDEIDPNLALA
ncbi:MAG: tRNA (adenosine(37)-N6)-threonylcarbamoyltransferase complex transferase subunit TsaD [Verrucomicrobia bacterium]|nr:MAG: tRNA (adenosine(37)-N6)-threonylcarbamoyltransferase complex transferase subunit TsaD [Verrucomicrobiota bacterium]